MSSEDSLKSLSLDYLNLLINGQAFSDVAFSVEGRLVHAHRCVLAARSLFFRKLFCGLDPSHQPPPPPLNWPTSAGGGGGGGGSRGGGGSGGAPAAPELVIPVSSIRYEVLVLVLQFLYSGQASVAAPKSGPLPGCGARGCWHTRCGAAVDLALDTLAAARSFGVEQLALLVQVGERKTIYATASIIPICIHPSAPSFFFLGICKHMLTRSPVVDALRLMVVRPAMIGGTSFCVTLAWQHAS
jgi:regulatory protein NPR1